MNFKQTTLSVALTTAFMSMTQAQLLNIDTFHYQDYLDFGQNKGKFIPTDTPFDYQGRNGNVAHFTAMPDFSHRNQSGNITAMGRNNVVTAYHVRTYFYPNTVTTKGDHYNNRWGNTTYLFNYDKAKQEENKEGVYGRDTMFLRTNKYVVEGKADALSIDGITENPSALINTKEKQCAALPEREQKVACYNENYARKTEFDKQMTDYLMNNLAKNEQGDPQLYQSGSGTLSFIKDNEKFGALNDPKKDNEGIQYNINPYHNGKSGGLWFLSEEVSPNSKSNQVVNWGVATGFLSNKRKEKELNFNGEGYVIEGSSFDGDGNFNKYNPSDFIKNKFVSAVDKGDSGSGVVAYDTKTKKWVLLGVNSETSFTDARLSPVLDVDYQDFKKKYEVIKTANDSLEKDKDNVFQTPVTLNFTQDLDLDSGGLVFQKGENTLTGTANISDIAGLDIEKNATLNLNNSLTLNGKNLHKVGDGTLKVNTATNGNLRFGNGTVELNNTNAFEKIYITGKTATVKLNSDFDSNNKLFFADGGGVLDLNGHNQHLTQISANNNRAKIINGGTQAVNLSLNLADNIPVNEKEKGIAYHFSDDVDKKANIVHAQIGDENHQQINVNVTGKADKKIAFDGGFNVNDLRVENGTVVLQSHPTLHAYLKPSAYYTTPRGDNGQSRIKPQNACDDMWVSRYDSYYTNPSRQCHIEMYQKYLADKNERDITRPSTLTQSDWDNRQYRAENITVNENANLVVASSTELHGNIIAKQGSTVNFGKNQHFIDRLDGENTYGNGFKYQQAVTEGTATADFGKKSFNDEITTDNATISSTIAHFSPSHLTMTEGELNADYWQVKDNQIANFTQNMTAKVKNLMTAGSINLDNSTLTVNEKFEQTAGTISGLNNATLNFNDVKFTQRGGNIAVPKVNLNHTAIADPVNLSNLTHLTLKDNSAIKLNDIDLADTTLQTDDSSNIEVATLHVPNKAVTLNANTKVTKELQITQGSETAVRSDKATTLGEQALMNIHLSQEFVDNEAQKEITIPFENLTADEQRVAYLDGKGDYRYTYLDNQIVIRKVPKPTPPVIEPKQEENIVTKPEKVTPPVVEPKQEEQIVTKPEKVTSPVVEPKQEEQIVTKPEKITPPVVEPKQEEKIVTKPEKITPPVVEPKQEEKIVTKPEKVTPPVVEPKQEEQIVTKPEKVTPPVVEPKQEKPVEVWQHPLLSHINNYANSQHNAYFYRLWKGINQNENSTPLRKKMMNKVRHDFTQLAKLADPSVHQWALVNDMILRDRDSLFTETMASHNGVIQALGGHYSVNDSVKLGLTALLGSRQGARMTLQYQTEDWTIALRESVLTSKEKESFIAKSTAEKQSASWRNTLINSELAVEKSWEFAKNWQVGTRAVLGHQMQKNSGFETEDFAVKGNRRQWLTTGAGLMIQQQSAQWQNRVNIGATYFTPIGDHKQRVGFIGHSNYQIDAKKLHLQWFADWETRYQITPNFSIGFGVAQKAKNTSAKIGIDYQF
ncbi:Serine protease pet autotransporter precursor [Phocoenobacter uteri]|uniref:Serine protease pet autotransporter n=1 Tax=Phocoenobacter uteri TaxID=146806 RepID=A0A379CAF4_9PAST|nr:S6 family peptidase [Phocoenobacter uteri]SUB59251.1 Serine protease pet autotransporter precursor [Phocoenobacter uteri]